MSMLSSFADRISLTRSTSPAPKASPEPQLPPATLKVESLGALLYDDAEKEISELKGRVSALQQENVTQKQAVGQLQDKAARLESQNEKWETHLNTQIDLLLKEYDLSEKKGDSKSKEASAQKIGTLIEFAQGILPPKKTQPLIEKVTSKFAANQEVSKPINSTPLSEQMYDVATSSASTAASVLRGITVDPLSNMGNYLWELWSGSKTTD